MLGPQDGVTLQLAGGGGSDIATLAPIQESPRGSAGGGGSGGKGSAGGVCFAPIGLVSMLNAGGAVIRWVGCGRGDLLACQGPGLGAAAASSWLPV